MSYGKGDVHTERGGVHTAKRVHLFCILFCIFCIFCILFDIFDILNHILNSMLHILHILRTMHKKCLDDEEMPQPQPGLPCIHMGIDTARQRWRV
jgi:hypothetical protein